MSHRTLHRFLRRTNVLMSSPRPFSLPFLPPSVIVCQAGDYLTLKHLRSFHLCLRLEPGVSGPPQSSSVRFNSFWCPDRNCSCRVSRPITTSPCDAKVFQYWRGLLTGTQKILQGSLFQLGGYPPTFGIQDTTPSARGGILVRRAANRHLAAHITIISTMESTPIQ